MKNSIRLKRLLAAMSCGALMGGAIMYACDHTTPKSATNPCHANKVCGTNLPFFPDGNTNVAMVCNNANTFPLDFHTECKDVDEESAVNCNGRLMACYRAMTCKPGKESASSTNMVCLDDEAFGDPFNATGKVEEACTD